MRHVAVIDPGTRVPELDCFNRMALAAPGPLSYHLPALFGAQSLRDREAGLCGVVVLGSGASVHDGLPWQEELNAWLLPKLKAGLPALGLCYGHQLLAYLLGSEVGFLREDREKYKGLRQVSLHANPLWGDACAGPLIVSHREGVIKLGPGLVGLGSTEQCAVEAFAHSGLPVWGFQAHPEATPAFAANNSVPFEGPAELLDFGHGLVDGFVRQAFLRAGGGR